MMNDQMKLYFKTVEKYMACLAKYDAAGQAALFTEEALIYSPLLGWVKPDFFFNKMKEVSGQGETTVELHNTCASLEDKPVITKHFTYHWGLNDGRKTVFEAIDVFEFSPDGQISKEIIIYDTYTLRRDLGGNPLA